MRDLILTALFLLYLSFGGVNRIVCTDRFFEPFKLMVHLQSHFSSRLKIPSFSSVYKFVISSEILQCFVYVCCVCGSFDFRFERRHYFHAFLYVFLILSC